MGQGCDYHLLRVGRRAAKNGSRGTDHGTAAHFFLSGNVDGGIHGGMADLERLHKGDLIFKTDYRAVFEFALSIT